MISPESILQQIDRSRSPQWDGWVPTYSGKGYRPWAKDPGVLSLEDVAWGLAHTFRYGGNSTPAVTVAEHVVLVLNIVSVLWPDKPHLKVPALFHDASEAVLHDIQSPIRKRVRIVGTEVGDMTWDESDLHVTRNIAKHFGVKPEDLDTPEIRAADILGCSFEKRDCPNLHPGDWGLPAIPPEVAHLRINGWNPGHAFNKFCVAAQSLGLT